MKSLISRLRHATARLSPGRAMAIAMLLGPLAGALLAYGAVAAQEPNEVTIDNFTFVPKELTVAVGTPVKWVSHDDIPHTVVDKNKAFQSKASTPTTLFPLRSPVPAHSIISAGCIRIWWERSLSSDHLVPLAARQIA
jgi:plastocyanin